MHRIRTILVATAFAVGLAGVAGATERADGYDRYPDDRGGTYGHGDYGHDGDHGRDGAYGRDGYSRDGYGRR